MVAAAAAVIEFGLRVKAKAAAVVGKAVLAVPNRPLCIVTPLNAAAKIKKRNYFSLYVMHLEISI